MGALSRVLRPEEQTEKGQRHEAGSGSDKVGSRGQLMTNLGYCKSLVEVRKVSKSKISATQLLLHWAFWAH